MSTDKQGSGGSRGATWRALMTVSAAALRERLRRERSPRGVHPGEPRVFAPSEFWSMDQRRDG